MSLSVTEIFLFSVLTLSLVWICWYFQKFSYSVLGTFSNFLNQLSSTAMPDFLYNSLLFTSQCTAVKTLNGLTFSLKSIFLYDNFFLSWTATIRFSSIGLGRQFTVGWISAGTLITFPFREYWPPDSSSLICINGICSAISLSSSWCKSSSWGFSGHFIPLTTDNFGMLLFLNAVKQVWQTYSSLWTDANFVQ